MNAPSPVGCVAGTEAAREALLSLDLAGSAGILWHLLVAAGPSGVTSAEMEAALYDGRAVPASWPALRARHLALLRVHAEASGLVILINRTPSPVRWSLASAPAPEPPPAATTAQTPPARRQAPSGMASILPIVFDGLAAAVDALHARSCRWPLDRPGAGGALFCTEVSEAGRPYCPVHRAQSSGGTWSPRSAA